MGSEHADAYQLGGGAAGTAEQIDAGGTQMITTAKLRKFIGAELLELACRGVLMALLKEKD
jgi:hypothetical protein